MIAYIVVEGQFDAQLLQFVLPHSLLEDVEIVVAGGVSAMKSLARSLLVRRQTPIIVVVDADSVKPDLIRERSQSIEEMISSVAGSVSVEVIVAVPEIEIIFFQDMSVLQRMFDCDLSEDLRASAHLQPRSVLEKLFSQSKKVHNRADIFKYLTHDDIGILQRAPVIQGVIKFLQSVHEAAKAPQGI
jgi:3,4-dihydroxy-2-butanone 4-phosphate synthase